VQVFDWGLTEVVSKAKFDGDLPKCSKKGSRGNTSIHACYMDVVEYREDHGAISQMKNGPFYW